MPNKVIKCNVCKHRINLDKDEDIYVDKLKRENYYHYECLKKEIEELLVKKQDSTEILSKGTGKIRRELREKQIMDKLVAKNYVKIK